MKKTSERIIPSLKFKINKRKIKKGKTEILNKKLCNKYLKKM